MHKHHYEPRNLSQLFELALDRDLPDYCYGKPELTKLNIGAGYKKIYGAIDLDLPEWNAETDAIPYDDGTVGVIYALGFLDHINTLTKFLRECERVLAPGGVLNISVAHVKSSMAWDDPYHKSWYTEDTWKKLFEDKYWKSADQDWRFRIGINIIMGVVYRNIAVITQLIRE